MNLYLVIVRCFAGDKPVTQYSTLEAATQRALVMNLDNEKHATGLYPGAWEIGIHEFDAWGDYVGYAPVRNLVEEEKQAGVAEADEPVDCKVDISFDPPNATDVPFEPYRDWDPNDDLVDE